VSPDVALKYAADFAEKAADAVLAYEAQKRRWTRRDNELHGGLTGAPLRQAKIRNQADRILAEANGLELWHQAEASMYSGAAQALTAAVESGAIR
jgi:hypothetical protein